MKHIIVSLFFILITTFSWAQSPAPWQGLLQIIKTDGQLMPTQVGDYMVLSDLSSTDRNQERVASYISGVGYHDNGEFIIGHVEAVWEDWRLNADGNFRVEQWLFSLSIDGSLERRSRSILILTPSGSYLGGEYPSTPDIEFESKWDNVLKAWYQKYQLPLNP